MVAQDRGQDRAEGEHVGSWADLLAARLLGRHEPDRAQQLTLHGQLGVCAFGAQLAADGRVLLGALQRVPGQPPIDDTHLAEGAKHDVRWLEVAVDDSAAVRVGDGLAHTHQVLQESAQVLEGRRLPVDDPHVLDVRVERAAGQVAHQQVGLARRGVAGLVDWGDTGVIEASGDDRLPLEAQLARLLSRRAAGHLERGEPPQLWVHDQVDDPHAPLTEDAAQDEGPVVAQGEERPPACELFGGGVRPRGGNLGEVP